MSPFPLVTRCFALIPSSRRTMETVLAPTVFTLPTKRTRRSFASNPQDRRPSNFQALLRLSQCRSRPASYASPLEYDDNRQSTTTFGLKNWRSTIQSAAYINFFSLLSQAIKADDSILPSLSPSLCPHGSASMCTLTVSSLRLSQLMMTACIAAQQRETFPSFWRLALRPPETALSLEGQPWSWDCARPTGTTLGSQTTDRPPRSTSAIRGRPYFEIERYAWCVLSILCSRFRKLARRPHFVFWRGRQNLTPNCNGCSPFLPPPPGPKQPVFLGKSTAGWTNCVYLLSFGAPPVAPGNADNICLILRAPLLLSPSQVRVSDIELLQRP